MSALHLRYLKYNEVVSKYYLQIKRILFTNKQNFTQKTQLKKKKHKFTFFYSQIFHPKILSQIRNSNMNNCEKWAHQDLIQELIFHPNTSSNSRRKMWQKHLQRNLYLNWLKMHNIRLCCENCLKSVIICIRLVLRCWDDDRLVQPKQNRHKEFTRGYSHGNVEQRSSFDYNLLGND